MLKSEIVSSSSFCSLLLLENSL